MSRRSTQSDPFRILPWYKWRCRRSDHDVQVPSRQQKDMADRTSASNTTLRVETMAENDLLINSAWSPTFFDQAYPHHPALRELRDASSLEGSPSCSTGSGPTSWESQDNYLEGQHSLPNLDYGGETLFNSPDFIDLRDLSAGPIGTIDRQSRGTDVVSRGGNPETEERQTRRQAQNREAYVDHSLPNLRSSTHLTCFADSAPTERSRSPD